MKFIIMFVVMFTASLSAVADVKQELGADQRVDYTKLVEQYGGPWDDRNYQLTADDLSVIPENDQVLRNVPLFFKVLVRKNAPHLGDFYNRETYQSFLSMYGGLIVDGHWYKEGLGLFRHPNDLNGKSDPEFRGGIVDPDFEILVDQGAETTLEFNPDNNMQVVAGANANGGQSMYYSTDGGENWTLSQVNPDDSCCDPTVDWSTTDVVPQRVYQAELEGCGFGGCNIRATFSEDGGQTWAPMVVIDGDAANDKEFIHVDRSPSSPYKDNVYITYHKGNVMQFAKSEDFGATWTTPVAVGTDTGIGSDITTDSAGNVYYFYPGLNGSGINLLKSTDGGDSFEPVVQVTPIRGRFDFPIPAMETREVFIYTSVDVDSNDNIYVAITDETADSTGGGTGAAAANRGEIRVFKSTDAGATWSELPKPHPEDGELSGGSDNAIDRFHPWLMVAENDAIHIGFYDTRNSTNRTGVDFYYNVSLDGGASWLPQGAQRYSTQTSSNIGDNFEWGDYNGLSVVLDKIAFSWTDNRASSVDFVVGLSNNQFGEPTFTLAASPTSIEVCSGDVDNTVTVTANDIQGYPGTITLSESATPGYVLNGAFSTNATTAPFSSDYTFDVDGSGTVGTETITILASGDDMGTITERTVDIDVTYSPGTAGASTLMMPSDGSTGVNPTPTFTWSADANATNYLIEVATDDLFNNIVVSETVATNSYTADSDLATSTDHYWRVTSQSPCGDSVSSVFIFTTQVAPGDCPIGTSQVDVYSYIFDDIVEPAADLIFADGFDGPIATPWEIQTASGETNWSLQPVGEGGSLAYQADDLPVVNDTSLVSPVMSLPVGVGPLTLRFWNTQTIEDNAGTQCYDSAMLEISVDGGPFVQVTNADIINDAYDGPITGGFDHPISDNRNAWCGDPRPETVFNVNADDNAGSDVQYRFRMTSDSSVGRPEGWAIDNVRITGCELPD
ncbi:hypothetical protein OS175_06125 [Marinicella sp. S1101]|uniref:hypothetical protein n=1 Tax=Marinicella marina TaxID=2996016 RepID=UPI002260D2B2|nr:hypothetical protein [Marinicella marina]MCX7553449.1 hypothetical protein [Marinicella marina]MDJ1140073.1 hypothetical protein [Marinicella marina]